MPLGVAMMAKHLDMRKLAAAVISAFLLTLWLGVSASAAEPAQGEQPAGANDCVTCHATPGLQMNLPDGGVKSVYVSPQAYADSVHGETLQCTACHEDMGPYPHLAPSWFRTTNRDTGTLLRRAGTCGNCHEQQYRDFLGSNHAKALVAGNGQVAVCSDCHTAHHIQPVDLQLEGMPLSLAVYACAECHTDQFAQFQASEHGQAALEKNDPNVPLCIDCHGSHHMEDPALPGFRSNSPYLCAACHADESLMLKYGLNTDVMATYLADFHGATVQLFPNSPERAPDQAVCYDCHGVHQIGSVIAPESELVRANLNQICQDCHPDAGENFPDAWMGHYTPSPEQHAPVYWIRTIYIGILTIGMAALVGHVGLDMNRVIVDRLRHGKKEEESDE